jgi:hypothetical protein
VQALSDVGDAQSAFDGANEASSSWLQHHSVLMLTQPCHRTEQLCKYLSIPRANRSEAMLPTQRLPQPRFPQSLNSEFEAFRKRPGLLRLVGFSLLGTSIRINPQILDKIGRVLIDTEADSTVLLVTVLPVCMA